MKRLIFLILFSIPLYATHYRILVLPCGGATNVMNAVLLEHLEKEIGKPIKSLFNEIWAESAGSIISALLTSPSSKCKSATAIIHLFNTIFSSYYNAYSIRQTAGAFIGSRQSIKDTSIPLRILTAASQYPNHRPFKPYDFSSDGTGRCSHIDISLAHIVAASCTVYPYLFRNPIPIELENNQKQFCIDAGSIGCQPPVLDPIAYFLKQLLGKLTSNDTVTIYFLGNAFIRSLDYQDAKEVLEKETSLPWAIRYEDGSFHPDHRVPIEIVNIPVPITHEAIVKEYLMHASFVQRTNFKILAAVFARIFDKEDVDPVLLAAGAVPLSLLISQARTMIEQSHNFKAMVAELGTSC